MVAKITTVSGVKTVGKCYARIVLRCVQAVTTLRVKRVAPNAQHVMSFTVQSVGLPTLVVDNVLTVIRLPRK